MAQESKRGCGYRKVGGTYLCGDYLGIPCDKLPIELCTCPVCGQGIKASRGFMEINAARLWGEHEDCGDEFQPCEVCQPKDDVAYIMLVGEKYYPKPKDFALEANTMGVSKRIPFVPKDLVIGQTVIFLAHHRAVITKIPVAVQQAEQVVNGDPSKPRLVETEKEEGRLGIFSAFIPQRVEKLIWESQATKKELASLKRRGITPIVIKNGDKDHE